MSCPFPDWGCSRPTSSAACTHLRMMNVSQYIVKSKPIKEAAAKHPGLERESRSNGTTRSTACRRTPTATRSRSTTKPVLVRSDDWKETSYSGSRRRRPRACCRSSPTARSSPGDEKLFAAVSRRHAGRVPRASRSGRRPALREDDGQRPHHDHGRDPGPSDPDPHLVPSALAGAHRRADLARRARASCWSSRRATASSWCSATAGRDRRARLHADRLVCCSCRCCPGPPARHAAGRSGPTPRRCRAAAPGGRLVRRARMVGSDAATRSLAGGLALVAAACLHRRRRSRREASTPTALRRGPQALQRGQARRGHPALPAGAAAVAALEHRHPLDLLRGHLVFRQDEWAGRREASSAWSTASPRRRRRPSALPRGALPGAARRQAGRDRHVAGHRRQRFPGYAVGEVRGRAARGQRNEAGGRRSPSASRC